MSRRRAAWVAVFALLLGSCRLAYDATDPVRYFDFGVPESREDEACCAQRIALDSLAFAPMLAGQTMWYREGQGSVEPRAFAVSRWSAPPAALLEQHVRVALGIGQSDRRAPLPYQLSLKLETMEQLFTDDGTEARLTVSAALTHTRDHALLGSRVFVLRRPADERSPLGGARAFAALVARLGQELQHWTCTVIDGHARGVDSAGEEAFEACVRAT